MTHLDSFMLGVSIVGRLLLWLAVASLGAALRRMPGMAICQMCLAMLLASLINDVTTKPIVRELRPFQSHPYVRVVGPRPADYSFPSGHTAAAFAAATALARAWPAGTVMWYGLAALVGYSRVYLGVHYPLDVAGGAVVGVLCALFAIGRTRWILSAPTRRLT